MKDQLSILFAKSDSDLLQQRNEAVEIYLRSVYKEHSASLYRYALALTCSVEDAQDAVQDVFIRISKRWRKFLDVENVQAYLFKSTRNASYSILRGRRKCGELHEVICLDLANFIAPQAKSISATIMSIKQAMDELTIEQREVIVLKILNQLTFKEIADMVGVPINTIAGRYRYGIEKLRMVVESN
jgi:RNA polymerase sigma-70 factor, ECF subfamily